MMPVTGGDQPACRFDRLIAAIARGQMHASVGIKPDGVATLLGIAIALVKQRCPGIRVTIHLDPGFQGHGAGQVQRRRRLYPQKLLLIQGETATQLPGNPVRRKTIGYTRGDRALCVRDRIHHKAVIDRRGDVAAAFDQQRVGAILSQREGPGVRA